MKYIAQWVVHENKTAFDQNIWAQIIPYTYLT